MKWRPIRVHFKSYCEMCHIELPLDTDAYYKRGQDKRGVVICNNCFAKYGVNDSDDTTVSPTTVIATTTPSPIAPSRDQQITKAHDENMKANERLCLQLQALTSALVDLMRVEADRNALLKKGLEAKQ